MQDATNDIDEWLFFSAAAIFVLSIYLILDKGLFSSTKENLSIAGKLELSENDVRRRTAVDFAWFPIYPNENVYYGDNVFTGTNSKANIDISESDKLALNPNTLITIEKHNEETTIELKQGSFSGVINKKIKIKADNKVYTLEGNGSQVEIIRRNNKTEIISNSGSIKVSSAEASEKIDSSESLVIDQQGSIQTVEHKLKLFAPALGETVVKKSEPVVFNWNHIGGKKQYVIQVSKNADFKNVILNKKVEAPPFKYNRFPANIPLYWKVEELNTSSSSVVGKFKITEDAAPTPVIPKNNREFFTSSSQLPLWFEWSDPQKSENFEIEIAKDKEFRKPVFKSNIEGNATMFKATYGNYFWRVRTKLEGTKTTSWSEARSFVIHKGLSAPKIKNPKIFIKPHDELSAPHLDKSIIFIDSDES